MYKKMKKKIVSSTKKALHKIKHIFRGFTVIELIVVISIIGTLASIILVSVTSYTGKARDSRIKTEASEIVKEAVMYYSNSATLGGYVPSSSFTDVCPGSSYEFSTDGASAFVVYAKLCTSDKYWCVDSTGNKTELDNPPDSETYACVAGSGGTPEAPWACGDALTDARDDKTYNTVLIGDQCWLAENLNVGTLTAGANNQGTDCPSASEIEKYCYDGSEGNCTTYGGLYQWNQAMCGSTTAGATGICPTGWHIPTHDEFTTLERAVCASDTCAADFPYDAVTTGFRGTDEGLKLQPSGGYGFDWILSGARMIYGYFDYLSADSHFWSSAQSGYYVWTRGLYSGHTTIYRVTDDKSYGFSVRCLKDN